MASVFLSALAEAKLPFSLMEVRPALLSYGIAITIVVLTMAVLYEQLRFRQKASSLPGPSWVVPFIGGIAAMVTQPFDFWHNQMKLGPLSWNSIVGQFMVVVCDAPAVRKVFMS